MWKGYTNDGLCLEKMIRVERSRVNKGSKKDERSIEMKENKRKCEGHYRETL